GQTRSRASRSKNFQQFTLIIMPATQLKRRSKNGSTSKARTDRNGNTSWKLRLYVAGQTAKSLAAFANLKCICEEHLRGKYDIEVVDLLKNPTLAKGDQILAIPTLVRKIPSPMRKIIGDLSDTERVLVGLDIYPSRGHVGK